MKIYLSGKITGTFDYEQKFRQYEKIVHSQYPHAEIVNPVLIGKSVEAKINNPTWWDYMKPCIRVLNTCTHIFLLPDWQESRGAKYELETAKSLGLTVLS